MRYLIGTRVWRVAPHSSCRITFSRHLAMFGQRVIKSYNVDVFIAYWPHDVCQALTYKNTSSVKITRLLSMYKNALTCWKFVLLRQRVQLTTQPTVTVSGSNNAAMSKEVLFGSNHLQTLLRGGAIHSKPKIFACLWEKTTKSKRLNNFRMVLHRPRGKFQTADLHKIELGIEWWHNLRSTVNR